MKLSATIRLVKRMRDKKVVSRRQGWGLGQSTDAIMVIIWLTTDYSTNLVAGQINQGTWLS